MDVTAILARQAEFERQRANFESMWDEIARRLFPRGSTFKSATMPGGRLNHAQYDSFPMLALHRYAAAMDSGLTPRTARWHRLRTGEEAIDDDPGVRGFLEQLNQELWDTRYAPRANFAANNHETFMSSGSFGTGAVFIDAHPAGGTRYRLIPLQELFIAEDFAGIIDTAHRKFSMTVRNIVARFRSDDAIPEKIWRKHEQGKLDEPFELLHVVMPRDDYRKGKLGRKGQRFTDIYILLDGAHLLREKGFYEFPYAINRHALAPGEVYGRGPGTMLLPDIKMLNEMRRTTIEAAEMAVDPPTLLADDGMLSEFRMVTGARNYGAVTPEGRPLALPFEHGGDLGISLEMMQDTRAQIDDAFLGVYFRVLLENPQMTATQALLVAQQQGQMVAPVVGRAQSEYLGPMIRRESGILFRQGRHPPMPGLLAEYIQGRGRELGIEYESPMTRAVRAEDGVAILRTFETLIPFAQVAGPQVFSRFDADKVAELVSEVNGVPMSVLKTDDQMAAEKQQAQAAQAAAGALEAAPVVADVVDKMSRARREAASTPEVVR